MSLFKISEKLELIPEKPFKLEKEIQALTEHNIHKILGLTFVQTEFSIDKFRIDTLAFDKESKSFVIIEYKKNKSFSVIDQGYAYLSLMLNNKADFILEFNECLDKSLKKADVDWSQSRVLFVSPQFTPYQRQAINFRDLPIELWEVKRFSNNIVSYQQVETQGAKESVKSISNTSSDSEVLQEVKVYTEEDHLNKVEDGISSLYTDFRDAILNLGDIVVKPKKLYVAFISNTNIVDISIQRKKLKMWINLRRGQLEDSKNLTRDVSKTGHWGNGDYELIVNSDNDLEYILSLVKQSLIYNAK
jgi:predicted transport protein